MSVPVLPVLLLIRFRWNDQGTIGVLRLAEGKVLYTAELPWRDNRNELSCIPAGDYACEFIKRTPSGRTNVWHVKKVPGRDGVLIHSGNYAGDTTLGLKTHSLGCILPGRTWGALAGQQAVLASKPAMGQLAEAVKFGNFVLQIRYAGDPE